MTGVPLEFGRRVWTMTSCRSCRASAPRSWVVSQNPREVIEAFTLVPREGPAFA